MILETNNGNIAPYLFHQGTNYRAYEYMGAHIIDGKAVFRVWAPNAIFVYLTGDFCNWNIGEMMTKVTEGGIFEVSIDASLFSRGDLYKYRIYSPNGEFLKADPYGFSMEKPPQTASRLVCDSEYKWNDEAWLKRRKKEITGKLMSRPVNIYEVNLGSWKRHADGSYYNYRELATELSEYAKEMGYTHVELMPVMEHPFDGSWGYQVTGYYAPTARYGTPDDFRAFVDIMHEAGIGVILDWVPAHFPKDAHGLYEFDGSLLYEYQGEDRKEHKTWGTRCFDVGRNEVQCFLVSNAVYWINEFHADGLRVDAVAAMLYLDFDKKPGEWVKNIYGDNKNLESIAFFKKLNSYIAEQFPDVMVIAEESTAWANITGFENDGLGFSAKWNMGWMNDMLSYAAMDPYFKKYEHNKATFSLMYAFSERFILPISHDEVVHGKKSFLDKMPGEYHYKFANARTFYTYMITHPGKKLMFMGAEIGQFREWDYNNELEWFLLDYEMHSKLKTFFADINHVYLKNPPLYEVDDSWDGFQWINVADADRSILSYRRIDKKGNEVICVINYTPVRYDNYILDVPFEGEYVEIINSDDVKYGGSGAINGKGVKSVNNDGVNTISITVPPAGAILFRRKASRKTNKD